jgi:hypothetical protein
MLKRKVRNEAEKGWIVYNRVMDAIDNELQDRGLVSTQQTGAEDLNVSQICNHQEVVYPD